VRLVEAVALEENRRVGILEVKVRLDRAQGDFAVSLWTDREARETAAVEVVAIPEISSDDAPTADQPSLGGDIT
jgi:hypothetical protein